MKLVIALLATMVAFSAKAADRKLGNVILVEREIPSPYDLCVKNLLDKPDKKQTSFFCVIKYTKSNIETPVNSIDPITYKDDNCKVRSEVGKGNMIISFGPENVEVDIETAKSCLLKGLTAHGPLTVNVMTIEQ